MRFIFFLHTYYIFVLLLLNIKYHGHLYLLYLRGVPYKQIILCYLSPNSGFLLRNLTLGLCKYENNFSQKMSVDNCSPKQTIKAK